MRRKIPTDGGPIVVSGDPDGPVLLHTPTMRPTSPPADEASSLGQMLLKAAACLLAMLLSGCGADQTSSRLAPGDETRGEVPNRAEKATGVAPFVDPASDPEPELTQEDVGKEAELRATYGLIIVRRPGMIGRTDRESYFSAGSGTRVKVLEVRPDNLTRVEILRPLKGSDIEGVVLTSAVHLLP